MAQETQFFLLVAVLSLGSLAYYGRLVMALRRVPEDRIDTSVYKAGDIVFAGILALFYISNIWATFAMTKKPLLTSETLIQGSIIMLFIPLSVVGFLLLRGINPIQAFGLRWKSPGKGLLVALGALVAVYPLTWLALLLTKPFLGIAPQDAVQFLTTHTEMRDRIAIIVFAGLIAPITEEVVFRGYLYGIVRKYGGRWVALFATALLFSAIHVHLPALLPMFLFGLVLGLVYEFTGSVWAAIFMHGTFNTLTIVAAINWPQLVP